MTVGELSSFRFLWRSGRIVSFGKLNVLGRRWETLGALGSARETLEGSGRLWEALRGAKRYLEALRGAKRRWQPIKEPHQGIPSRNPIKGTPALYVPSKGTFHLRKYASQPEHSPVRTGECSSLPTPVFYPHFPLPLALRLDMH